MENLVIGAFGLTFSSPAVCETNKVACTALCVSSTGEIAFALGVIEFRRERDERTLAEIHFSGDLADRSDGLGLCVDSGEAAGLWDDGTS